MTIDSTLEGETVLPRRIRWVVSSSLPPEEIRRVEFVIDRKVRWIDNRPPFMYGGDGAYLVTNWIFSGFAARSHRFTVRVVDAQGMTFSETLKARIAEPELQPNALAGFWGRTPTMAERKKAALKRVGPGGRWRLLIYRSGELYAVSTLHDGHGYEFSADAKTLRVLAPIHRGPKGVGDSHFGWRIDGYDCHPGGPFASYAWSLSKEGLVLSAKREPCERRRAFLEGVWERED